MNDQACLNHSDLDELEKYDHLLDPDQQDRLSAIRYRIKNYPDRFDRPRQNYRLYAGILAMAEFKPSQRLCSCAINNHGCRVWKFCPYCAWRMKMELLKKFLTKYGQHKWYFMTLAFEGFLSLYPGLGDNLALYWDACVYAIKRMVQEGYFKGAVWSEELHIQSFLNYEGQPHVHVVIMADALPMANIELLKTYVCEYRGQTYDPQQGVFVPDDDSKVTHTVSTRTRPVKTRFYFANVLSYLAKASDLSKPYQRDFKDAMRRGRGAVAELNQNVTEILNGFADQARNRRQIDYKGQLDARSSTKFVGVKKAARSLKSHYANVQNILKVENLEHGGLDNPDDPETYGSAIEQEAQASVESTVYGA